ncbi:FAD-dependent 5-carboxymethylaminomethyl-2-thiouridine(34) oxidoreductase MnmC [Shewanella psychrotolerans]|uniref:FAD-dependent 5-carboxymethylaminomethyl-2-thiouridine(34) oxidoreductase MnmC n=1 Tax=Shewanella psychrotolerans TaxID=2864206 RepID=UPI001C65DD8E|nr:FAD-dependent 5-carboxymethylaminomethyl-2-thiouridine(34) oxidoreductase MnmC [Shewanella psychrotolerans]QYK02708.1 FAD-dependent 5-carboxymethylaminomethyl-2-thiouridine(34) oxidoreductase MnmC [Shewanella psychrotolerans]
MPNNNVRVNSLAKEREEKTQISVNKSDIDAIFSDLSPNSLPPKATTLALLGQDMAPVISAFAHSASKKQLAQARCIHVFVDRSKELIHISNALGDLPELAAQLDEIANSNVDGCHSVIACDGVLSLVIHIGELANQLKNISSGSEQRIMRWLICSLSSTEQLNSQTLWQMARLSNSDADLLLVTAVNELIDFAPLTPFLTQASQCGFRVVHWCGQTLKFLRSPDKTDIDLAKTERSALRRQYQQAFNYNPLHKANPGETAIIGGGVASACLALSLAERGQTVSLFCMDEAPGQQASGNKQGAIYPLLTPEHGTLSHFFLQGYLFSRQRINTLVKQGYQISHDFCGVLQTGHDERSTKRLHKIISSQPWANNIAQSIRANAASTLAGVDIGLSGIYYPLGGWVCPQEFTAAAIEKAASLAQLEQHYKTNITSLKQIDGQWYLITEQGQESQQFGPFANVVLANGRHITDFSQTAQLPISGFRGQVSHIPSRGELTRLKTVLCSHGYLTPQQDGLHCTGASYIKDPINLDYSATEQFENLNKIRTSYQTAWTRDVDITGHSARVGVRMVTRDHAPMMGCAPDFDAISKVYQSQQPSRESAKYWQSTKAPVHDGLFVLGGLGSRGLTSGPLAAEILAAQMCGELLPTTMDVLSLLNPNRMWMRKLIKGKALL